MGIYEIINGHPGNPTHHLQKTDRRVWFFCNKCRQEDADFAFTCAVERCCYCVHIVCARPASAFPCRFFTANAISFRFQTEPRRRHSEDFKFCAACERCIEACCYCAAVNDDEVYLHPACAALLHAEPVEHRGQMLNLMGAVNGRCDRCKLSRNTAWSYVSDDRALLLHVKCERVMRIEAEKNSWSSAVAQAEGTGAGRLAPDPNSTNQVGEKIY